MNTDLYIARRITAGDSSGHTSPAVKVAIASVALSIAVMLLAASIVGGFRREILQKVTGFNSHISLYTSAADGTGPVELTPPLDSIIASTPGVESRSLSASIPALLKTAGSFRGIYLRGISQNRDTAFLSSCLVSGRMPRSNNETLISTLTAKHLGLNTGDSVNLYIVSENIRARKLLVSGLYNSHFENYDDYLAYSPLPLIQELGDLTPAQGSVIDINLKGGIKEIPETSALLIERLNNAIMQGQLNQVYHIDTALERGANYIAWLDMLDTNVWIILALMTLVALFTLISGILIIILEKVRFIGVMKAIGSSSGRLRHIFVLLAVRIAATGLIIGNIFALLIIGAQALWHFIPLNPEAYYLDYVPVSLNLLTWLGINLAFVVIIYTVLILPARLVSRISPSESMRFEH